MCAESPVPGAIQMLLEKGYTVRKKPHAWGLFQDRGAATGAIAHLDEWHPICTSTAHMAQAVPDASPPIWAASLGVIAIVFGTLMTAAQGNELMVQTVIGANTAAARNIPADCRQDEAEQEGVSLAECELMVANVRIMIASRPSWFRRIQQGLALLSTLAALGSIVIGLALTGQRRWAPAAAVPVFAALLVLDVAGFTAAFYTGPLLRALYLWNILLWLFIHMCLVAGAVAGRSAERLACSATRVSD